MTDDNPELYEFMLAALMDQNHHIPIAKVELAPSYDKEPISDGKTLPDGRKIIAVYHIKESTNKEHSSLYRLAFAIRSLQDAFTYGNSSSIPEGVLRYTINETGKPQVIVAGGELLTLSSSTITLKEVTSWMKGFSERTLKDDPDFQTNCLTDWIKLKLNTYLGQVDADDKEKIEALFEYYHLFDDGPDLSNAKPITPKEIGYLSPRVFQPLYTTEPTEKAATETVDDILQPPTKKQPEVYNDIKIMLEDGSALLVNPVAIDINMQEQ